MKTLLRIVIPLILCLVFVSPNALAKNKLVVNWVPDVYSMRNSSSSGFLDDATVRIAITNKLTEKLRSLDKAGKLPFELNESSSGSLNNVREDYSDSMPIGLIPMMIFDQPFSTSYQAGTDTFYRDIIACSLSIAIVSGEDESHSQRILAVVPMSGYTELGNLPNLIKEPIPYETKKNTFIALACRMIDNELDFSKVSKALKDWEVKQVLPETYQVTNVSISSKKGQGIFGSKSDNEMVKAIISNFFTTAYQKTTGKIVLPPINAQEAMKEISTGVYAFEMRSLSNQASVTYAAPKHKIELNFNGCNTKEIERSEKNESYARTDFIYRAWLSRKIDGNEIELDSYETHNFSKTDTYEQMRSVIEKNTYVDLLIGLARKLGERKG